MNRSMPGPSARQERNVTETCQEIWIYCGLSESDNEWYERFYYIPFMVSKPFQNGEENQKVKSCLNNRKQDIWTFLSPAVKWWNLRICSTPFLQLKNWCHQTRSLWKETTASPLPSVQELVKEAEGAICWLDLRLRNMNVHGGGFHDSFFVISQMKPMDQDVSALQNHQPSYGSWDFWTCCPTMREGIYYCWGPYWVVVPCWKYSVSAQ